MTIQVDVERAYAKALRGMEIAKAEPDAVAQGLTLALTLGQVLTLLEAHVSPAGIADTETPQP